MQYYNINLLKLKLITFKVSKYIIIITLVLCFSQIFFAHRCGNYIPQYNKIELTYILNKDNLQQDDYDTIFVQSGLGRPAIDYLMEFNNNYKQIIKEYQTYLFEPKSIKCKPLLGFFTREDVLATYNPQEINMPFICIQPGDIIVTTSTHSLGWRHGHCALALGKGRTLESTALGNNSVISPLSDWNRYSNFAVLRVINSSEGYGLSTAQYAYNNLLDIPYRLTCGFLGGKAPAPTSSYFGLQCSYLVWYAWQANGVDLDSDGGKLVTPVDILQSKQLEVVQLFGMDPKTFL